MKLLSKTLFLAGVMMLGNTSFAGSMSSNMMSSDSSYVSFLVGGVMSAEDLMMKELQSSDFTREGSTIASVGFHSSYGSAATETSSNGRTFKYEKGISGTAAYGFNVGGNLRVEAELFAAFQKPDTSESKSDYFGVDVTHDNWAAKRIKSTGSNFVDTNAAAITTWDATATAAHGTIKKYNDGSTDKDIANSDTKIDLDAIMPYRADGTEAFRRLGVMFNTQVCVTCAMKNSKVNLYLGAGAGPVHYKLYKASKLGVAYQLKTDIEYKMNKDLSVVSAIKYGGIYSPQLKGVALKGWDDSKADNIGHVNAAGAAAGTNSDAPTSTQYGNIAADGSDGFTQADLNKAAKGAHARLMGDTNEKASADVKFSHMDISFMLGLKMDM